jgi:hypothetical protein
MDDQTCRRIERHYRGWNIAVAFVVMLIIIPWNARGQTSSSSRPLSATVIGTYVARDGELALLVRDRDRTHGHHSPSREDSPGASGAWKHRAIRARSRRIILCAGPDACCGFPFGFAGFAVGLGPR